MTCTRILRAVAGALLVAGNANGQPTSSEAMASELFIRGQELMAAGDYKEACPKLEQAAELVGDGIGAHLAVGQCMPHIGRTATALAALKRAASLAESRLRTNPKDSSAREKLALIGTELERLQPALTFVRVVVPKKSRIVGLQITLDGNDLGAGVWGENIPVDRGIIRIDVSADGYRSRMLAVDAVAAGVYPVSIPELNPLETKHAKPEDVAVETPGPVRTGPADLHQAPSREPEHPVSSFQRTAGWVGIALGAASLGTASYFYIDSRDKISSADCANECATPLDKQLHDDGRTAETTALIFGVGGGVLATLGVVLVATAPASPIAMKAYAGSSNVRVTFEGIF